MAVPQPSYPKWLRYSQLSHEGPPRGVRYGCSSELPAIHPYQDGCPVCIAAIVLEAMAALQLAQPSLGKMAVKEPAQPFWVPAPTQIGGLFPMTRTKTPYLPTYCGRQSPGSVPHLPTYSQAAQRSEKIPVSPL